MKNYRFRATRQLSFLSALTLSALVAFAQSPSSFSDDDTSSADGIVLQSSPDASTPTPLPSASDTTPQPAKCSAKFSVVGGGAPATDSDQETLCCKSQPLLSQFASGTGTISSSSQVCIVRQAGFLNFYFGNIYQNDPNGVPTPVVQTPPEDPSAPAIVAPSTVPSVIAPVSPADPTSPVAPASPVATATSTPAPVVAPQHKPAAPISPPPSNPVVVFTPTVTLPPSALQPVVAPPVTAPNLPPVIVILPSPSPTPTALTVPTNNKPFKTFDAGGSCWDNNPDVVSTGPFARLSTHAGYDQIKSCMTLQNLGDVDAAESEPHAYGGFSFKIGSNTLLIDMGLEGQSGQAWMNKSGKNTSGMIPFLRMNAPANSVMTVEKSHYNNTYETAQINADSKYALIQADNDEDSPFRFHVGDYVCMTLSMSTNKDLTDFEVQIDPNTTLKRQEDSDHQYRFHPLKEILTTAYKNRLSSTTTDQDFNTYLEDSVKFGLTLRAPNLRVSLPATKARLVMSVATSYKFTGSDMDDADMDVVWEKVQAHRINYGWVSLMDSQMAEQDASCTETTRSPSKMIRSYTNGADLILSIRAGHHSMNLNDATSVYLGSRTLK